MTDVALGRLVRLINAPASDADYLVAAETIESSTGQLVAGAAVEVDGAGTSFQEGDVLFGKLRPYLAKVWCATGREERIGDN